MVPYHLQALMRTVQPCQWLCSTQTPETSIRPQAAVSMSVGQDTRHQSEAVYRAGGACLCLQPTRMLCAALLYAYVQRSHILGCHWQSQQGKHTLCKALCLRGRRDGCRDALGLQLIEEALLAGASSSPLGQPCQHQAPHDRAQRGL